MVNNFRLLESKRIFLFVCVILFIGLFILSGDIVNSRLGKELWNVLHLIAFFVIWLFLVNIFSSLQPVTLGRILKIIIITLITSAIIEVVQHYIGRSASLKDIGLNTAGTIFALIVTILANKYFRKITYLIVAIFLVIAGFLIWPSSQIFIDEIQRRLSFPELADFSKPFELGRWSTNHATIEIKKTEIGHILNVILLPEGKYSSVTFNPISAEWDKYRELVIVVVNNNKAKIPLTIRINDELHNNQYNDRYNKSRELPVGLSTITVSLLDLYKAPKNRKMDINHIRAVSLFATDLESETNFEIKRIYLHK